MQFNVNNPVLELHRSTRGPHLEPRDRSTVALNPLKEDLLTKLIKRGSTDIKILADIHVILER